MSILSRFSPRVGCVCKNEKYKFQASKSTLFNIQFYASRVWQSNSLLSIQAWLARFILSRSDDFNIYIWKIPDSSSSYIEPRRSVTSAQLVIYGHRSIVNQVRYNPVHFLFASCGIEKTVRSIEALFNWFEGVKIQVCLGSVHTREQFFHEEIFPFGDIFTLDHFEI